MSDLEVVESVDTRFTAVSEFRDWEFHAKWDGCVEVVRYFNGSTPENYNPDDVQCLHICDAGELMDQLFQLVRHAAGRGHGEWAKPVEVVRQLLARLSPEERALLNEAPTSPSP